MNPVCSRGLVTALLADLAASDEGLTAGQRNFGGKCSCFGIKGILYPIADIVKAKGLVVAALKPSIVQIIIRIVNRFGE